jgi:hypothetical protein
VLDSWSMGLVLGFVPFHPCLDFENLIFFRLQCGIGVHHDINVNLYKKVSALQWTVKKWDEKNRHDLNFASN